MTHDILGRELHEGHLLAEPQPDGTVTCDDCGTRVRPETLESLPPHNCTTRRAHNEQIRILDAGQPAGAKTAWVPQRFRRQRDGEG